jgi:hypothetical protein
MNSEASHRISVTAPSSAVQQRSTATLATAANRQSPNAPTSPAHQTSLPVSLAEHRMMRCFITGTVAPHAALQPKDWRSKTEHGT